MKFWTFQRREFVDPFKPIVPDWSKEDPISGCSMEAYRYILQIFNSCTGRSDTGLIFGYSNFEYVDEIYECIEDVGEPSGSYFPKETHIILELEVPDDIPCLTIDFYRFSDLLFCFEYGGDDTCTLDEAKRDLLEPNRLNHFELPVSHIPCIMPEWIVNRHEPR